MKKKLMLNNKGFTLVELIVTIAIIAIVGGIITALVINAQGSYNQGMAETDLQYEAQLLANQLQDLIIDTTKGISYEYAGTAPGGSNAGGLLYDESGIVEGTTVSGKNLYVYGNDTYYLVEWDTADSRIYYTEYDVTTQAPSSDRELMAEYVSNFVVDLSDVDTKGTVKFELSFKKEASGREYSTSHKIKLRNKVMANVGFDQMYSSP